ncbi:hypothetical protein GCM10010406_21740 [Streptomyces thermolineatus]|uniref:Helix-turn-helix domain-containing protein n=1 Tax=Streptomyces thermolineatus TaxID=44033 RepID=A0ABP5YS20_9ACTN
MTRKTLARETPVAGGDLEDLITRITTEVRRSLVVELELKCFTPAEAGELLGKTENWVLENIWARKIPFTYVGKSPRLKASHIRAIADGGEVLPSRVPRKAAAKPTAAAA